MGFLGCFILFCFVSFYFVFNLPKGAPVHRVENKESESGSFLVHRVVVPTSGTPVITIAHGLPKNEISSSEKGGALWIKWTDVPTRCCAVAIHG